MDNSKNLNIIALDAMGGDHGPVVTVPAAVEATKKKDLAVILVGEKQLIEQELSKFSPVETSLLSVVPAQGVVTEEESPALAYRTKPQASVYVAAGIVKEGEASGFVSMGSTGASIAASTVLYGTMDGIERGAVGGPVIGYSPRTVIVDLGTNVDTRPEQLLDFGALGSIMSRVMYKEKNPKIALWTEYELVSRFSTPGMGLNHVLMIFSESRDDFRWNMLFSKNFSTFMVFVWILRENPQNDPFLALTKGKNGKIGKNVQKVAGMCREWCKMVLNLF